MDLDRLCLGCMREKKKASQYCSYCGYKSDSVNSSRGLQPRTVLNGKYLIGKIIGEGGFGITYIAFDLVLNYRVAVKEYFPSELVTRDTSTGMQTALMVLTGSKEEQYRAGLDRFVEEARNLARFNNLEGIVSVKEFFYENNTAYMVMEYIDGISLSDYLNNHGDKLPYTQVLEMMSPVMDSLEKVHEGSIIHRDISPDNIMVSNDGKVKLIDFGAARVVDADNKSLTVILKHGYAPEEQYQSHGNQGPWTDIYALSATMYRMITGVVPQESTDRILSGDKVVPVNKMVPEVPKKVSDAIMHGLAIKAAKRPQTIIDFRAELEKGRRSIFPFFIAGIAVMLLTIGIVGIAVGVNILKKTPRNVISEPEEIAIASETTEPESAGSEYVSEIPEVKVLTEEEKQALWKEYQDKIMNVLDITPDDDRLHGYFDDYDGDGDYELFMGIGTYSLFDVFCVDDNDVWISGVRDRNSKHRFLNIEQNRDRLDTLHDILADILYSNDESDPYGRYEYKDKVFDFPMEVASFGKQKICYDVYYMAGEEYDCFTVWEGEPWYYPVRIESIEDVLFCQTSSMAKCFTAMGEELQFGHFFAYYSPYYLHGDFGELASCQLTAEQYRSIDGLVGQIDIYRNKTLEIEEFISWSETSSAGGWEFDANDIEVDSVYYNEAGYFIINYKCFGLLKPDGIDWEKGAPYYVSMICDEVDNFTYSGENDNMGEDTIEGIYSHVILKYDGNTYTFLNFDSGYIGESVTDNILATSKCPWIN